MTAEAVRAASEAHTADEGTLFVDDRASFTARVDGKRAVPLGQEIELAVDHTSLHCFDPATGEALERGAPAHSYA